jgi:exodeoxyribonuclease VII large subunit
LPTQAVFCYEPDAVTVFLQRIMNGIQPITLTELCRKIQSAVNQYFGQESHWIIAEITSHKFYPNNDRHYFDFIEKEEGIQEPQAKIRGISWFQGSQSIKNFEQQTGQTFTNGLQVLCRVRVEYHPAHGMSLIVLEADPSFTLGNLEKQRRETLEKLVLENPGVILKDGEEYITTNNQSKLPLIIQDIAVIGSPNSEGYTDFVHTINNNQYGYTFRLFNYQTSVQGSGAETEIISTLIEIHQSEKKFDSVVIIRGGGAKTDFLIFDTYRLARAAARFPIPIITGIGHHKDVSIVDMMVHTNTKTPTKAAEFIISHNRFFEEEVNHVQKKIIIRSQQIIAHCNKQVHTLQVTFNTESGKLISHHKDQLHYFRHVLINQSKAMLFQSRNDLTSTMSLLLTRPVIITKSRMSGLDAVVAAIRSHATHQLVLQKGYIHHYESMMQLMHPANLLKKGFAIIKQQNAIISHVEKVDPSQPLTVMLQDGTLETTVVNITSNGQQPDL